MVGSFASNAMAIIRANPNFFPELVILENTERVRAPRPVTYTLIGSDADCVALLQEEVSLPFVIAIRVKSRRIGFQRIVKLSLAIREAQKNDNLPYAIDWWTRPLSQTGPGCITVAFRFCDFREMG